MSKHTAAQVEDMIATENDEVVRAMLREYADLLAKKKDTGTTHYAGCIQAGPKHYECALQEIGRLRLTITDLRVKLEASKQEAKIHKLQAEKNYELGTEYFDLYTKAVRGQLKERK